MSKYKEFVYKFLMPSIKYRLVTLEPPKIILNETIAETVEEYQEIDGEWKTFATELYQCCFKKNETKQLYLKENFLREKLVQDIVAPYYRELGLEAGEYVLKSSLGRTILAKYSDSMFGQPFLLYTEFPTLSTVSIQNLSYLILINSVLNIDLHDSNKNIHFIEFGGGYGNMLRILSTLFPNLKISCIDLNIMTILQKEYLKISLPNINWMKQINFYENFPTVIEDQKKSEIKTYTHLNATFSLSETDELTRDSASKCIRNGVDSFLIVYSKEKNINYIDNTEWIVYLSNELKNEFIIKEGTCPGFQGGSYVIGKRIVKNCVDI